MIKPLNDNIAIIYQELKETTTESGIIVTGRAAEDRTKPAIAIVAALGPEVTIDVKVGDVVFWDRKAKGVCDVAIIVHESTLLAVIDEDSGE